MFDGGILKYPEMIEKKAWPFFGLSKMIFWTSEFTVHSDVIKAGELGIPFLSGVCVVRNFIGANGPMVDVQASHV